MTELPSGTVTFLFTDVEGSTRLVAELGDAYAAVLADHRRALREAFARHGGVEVDTQGDAFFVAFDSAREAVAAAKEAQSAFAEGPIHVRMGLHTGEATVTAEGYIGIDVHRAARIAAAGHGGQILVSHSTRELVDGDLRDLGEHRLKDLSAAERLYQLGDGEFPRLITLYQTNLPVPATPFLGRDRELAEVSALLAHDDVRMLTLTGPGGTGKTRLALQATASLADNYPDGVWWVPLAPLRDPALVLESAARAVGAAGPLAEHVGDKRLLLLLDNFEHLVEAATGLSELVSACPRLDVLVTSRELLQIAGEHAYPVPSLETPEARELFTFRARAARPDFEANGVVDELCTRLDNLPLALELAAARMRHLAPEQLLERLERRLDLLRGGRDADPRQLTLRATIQWSYDLLDEKEQRLFARLAVFAGGCTLEAAEAVCDADLDTLGSLADKSLVRHNEGRYWMLETIREYAAERLESAEVDELRRRHAEFFLDLARSLGLTIERIESAGAQRHQVAVAEQGNVRAALDWAVAADPELGLRLAVELENFWVTQNPLEGLRRFDALLEHATDVPLDLRAQVLRCLGSSSIMSGEPERGERFYEQALELYEQLGDDFGVAHMCHRLGASASQRGNLGRARSLLETSLASAHAHGFRLIEAQILGSLGAVEHQEGRLERALELVRHSVELARAGGFVWWEGRMNDELAAYALELGQLDEAEKYARAALILARRMGDRILTLFSLARLAHVAAERGEADRAGWLWGAIEAEEARGLLGAWERYRDELKAPVLANLTPELERGLQEGRRLSVDEAVEDALADG